MKVMHIYFCCFLNFFCVSATLIPIYAIVTRAITGNQNHVSSTSSLANTSLVFLSSLTQILFVKCTASFSDYIGRKPPLIIGQLFFTIAISIYIYSRSIDTYYGSAVIANVFACAYTVSSAWLCDILTEENRAKAYSMIFGLSIGLSFSTGIPTGAILTATVGPRIAILVSLVISLLTSVYMLLIPINDTLGCKSRHLTNSSKELMMVNSPSEVLAHWDFQYRSFPEKLGSFIHEHLPFTGFFIIVKAKQPLEWLCYFLSQIALQTLILTYLSFGIHTFAWTTPEAGYSLAIVGIVMAIVSPTIAHQFKEKSAIFFGFGFSIIGYILLAICGSNVTDAEFVPRSTVGYFGIFLVTIGFVKEPALATMVSRQYDKDMLGEVNGVISQLYLLASFVAFPISLLFSYTIDSSAKFYWPGVCYAVASVVCAVGLCVHWSCHKTECFDVWRDASIDSKTVITESEMNPVHTDNSML